MKIVKTQSRPFINNLCLAHRDIILTNVFIWDLYFVVTGHAECKHVYYITADAYYLSVTLLGRVHKRFIMNQKCIGIDHINNV